MGNEYFEPDAKTWDLFHQMLNGSAQSMDGSSVPPGSSHVQREGGAEGCSAAARLPEALPDQPKAASLLLGGSPLGVEALALAAQVGTGSGVGVQLPGYWFRPRGGGRYQWALTLTERGASLPLCRFSPFKSLDCEAGLRSCFPYHADLVCGGRRAKSRGEWW